MHCLLRQWLLAMANEHLELLLAHGAFRVDVVTRVGGLSSSVITSMTSGWPCLLTDRLKGQ